MTTVILKIAPMVAVVALFAPVALSAHGVGESFEQEVGGFYIDVGYNTFLFTEGSSVRFDFLVTKSDSGEPIEYTDAFVRIEEGERVVFAGRVYRPLFGPTVLTYTFPRSGEYTFDVSFQNGDERLVEASFPLTVEPEETSGGWVDLLLPAFVGFVLGAAALRGGKLLTAANPEK